MTPAALVSNPALIPGLKSWTIETRSHRGGVNAIAYSPDGMYLATAGDDGTVRLWDPASKRPLRVLVGHDRRVNSISWEPHGKALASGSDGTLCVWEAASGKLRRAVATGQYTDCVAWSPDGQKIATGGRGRALLWEANSGQHVGKGIDDPHGFNVRLGWAVDSRKLAIAYWDSDNSGSLRVWDTVSGEVATIDRPGKKSVCALCWSPDGKTLAAATGDKVVELRSAETPALVRAIAMGNVTGPTALAWDSAGNRLAVAASGRILNIESGEIEPRRPAAGGCGRGRVVAGRCNDC